MGTNCKLHSDRGVQKLLQDLHQLLHESKSADTVFFVGVKEVPMPCHSFMLKQRCKSYRSDQQRFPSTSPELFQLFLNYVYTGRLAVEESCLLDLLCLAAEFGMEDLEETCEQLIYSCVEGSPSKACQVLSSAVSKKRKMTGTGGTRPRSLQAILTHCTRLIGESPAELFQSPKFLCIPSDTLIAIVSSDQLCLEEEQIWRYVLKWAQYNAGVDTPLREWSEEERLQVAKYLSPVIGHVRLLLIDSRIFAEEVEPTGCVPMALSLERYRFAALQAPLTLTTTTTSTLHAHAIPRKMPKLFQSSLIIHNPAMARKLNEWHGQAQSQATTTTAAVAAATSTTSWKCIYRASLHGFSADVFHKHCDGHAPTYTIVQVQTNNANGKGNANAIGNGSCAWICGGYTDVPWSRPRMPKYVASSKSFLFSHTGAGEPLRFTIQRKHFAVCHHEESGPIFGAGADLYIASNCDTPAADSYSNIGHTYAYTHTAATPEESSGSCPNPKAKPGNGEPPLLLVNGNGHGPGTLTRRTGPPPATLPLPPTPSPPGAQHRLTPTYNFTVTDYEVFIPIPAAAVAAAITTTPDEPQLPERERIHLHQNGNPHQNGNGYK